MPSNGSERKCSNCNKTADVKSSISVTHRGKILAVICDECQQAKKIQLTFEKKRSWKFSQYFPVEV